MATMKDKVVIVTGVRSGIARLSFIRSFAVRVCCYEYRCP